MRIVFMGTPDFAVPSLSKLICCKDLEVAAIVTAPDHLGGRGGKQLLQSAVKKFALEHDIMILQPEKLRSKEFLNQLRGINADIFVVVAFRMLPEVVWSIPRIGTINLHGSLLPKYRGAAPINWAIINGEEATGVTTFRLKHMIDTGDILLQRSIKIDDEDNATSMHDKMMIVGADLLLDTIMGLKNQTLTPIPQSDNLSCHAPKLFHENCEINFNLDCKVVHNFVRGLSHYPLAHTILDGKEIKIDKAMYERSDEYLNLRPGQYITDNKKRLAIVCKNGILHVLKLKMEGKKLMETHEFLNGYKPLNAVIWSSL